VSPTKLILLLERLPIRIETEAAMQLSLSDELTRGGVVFEREVRLSPTDRIDFLIGSIGVEMKTKGSFVEVVRQLQRYATHERIRSLVLFTSSPKLLKMPKSIGKKRVHVAFASLFGGAR
jgi:hypothetical protein